MDNKIVFVRTSKGEDEAQSRTMHLPGDIKRALLMVDGESTFGEISKRAAPSLRAGLDAMLQGLEKDGYIRDKSKVAGITRMAVPPKMSVPPKIVTPKTSQSEAEAAGDLDFMSGYDITTPSVPTAKADHATPEEGRRLKADAEERAKQEIEIEAAKFEAQQEAEALLRKAEQEAARIREEAEREKQRIAAEIQAREEAARRVKEEAEAALLKAEQALKARQEAEAKAQQQAEAARKKAEKEAAIAREAAERVARQEREAAKAREEAEKRSGQEAVAGINEAPSVPKPDTFTFDAFHVNEPKLANTRHEAVQPEHKAMPAEPAPAGKTDTFAFDSFQIETPQQPAELPEKAKTASVQQPQPEGRHPAQHEAAQTAAPKVPASSPSHEEIERATQERIAKEKRMEEEAIAAKKHAEAQAKAHAQAEKRAAETARVEKEQAFARQVKPANVPHVAKSAQVARVRRKPFSSGKLLKFMFKLGVFMLVLLVGALFVAPYVLPTRDYVPKIETFLSAKLHQPVRIGHLSGRFLPTPRLELSEVYIGKAKQLQTEQALINFALKGLVIETKPVNSIELQGVKVSGAGLESVSAWLQQLAADSQYPVESIVISRGTLDAGAAQFTDVEATLDFDSIGELTNANLRSNGGKYVLDLSVAPGAKMQVAIAVRGSALPLFPNWYFDELTAKGELDNNGLSIREFNGGILDGFLQGGVSIGWRSGWRAQGSFVAKTISMQRLNKLLEGNVEGSARFKMSAADLAGMADSAVLEGSFTSKNGLISGMDIIETARSHSRDHVPGGRTHFDDLSGSVAYASNTLHLKQVRITSNVLDAVAGLDIDMQKISGSVFVRLMLEEGMKPVNLQIGGVTDMPTLRFAP